jgi:DNA mismatch endonuclease (patch repair protein)
VNSLWHQHDDQNCRFVHSVESRVDYWADKLNKKRDENNQSKLISLGWDVLVIWECQINDSDKLSKKIASFLGSRE